MKQNKLIYLIGIPGSGKSEFAKILSKKERATILSTDEIRRERFGDATKQKNTTIIYGILYARAKDALASGQSVIIDATNVDREKREKALERFPDVKKECYYFTTPFSVSKKWNERRKRKIDESVLKKYQKNLHFPVTKEGWDEIHFKHESVPYSINKEQFLSIMNSDLNCEDLFANLQSIPYFCDMIGYDQNNPYHAFSLELHTFEVLRFIRQNYIGVDKLDMEIAALFHDAGKPFCKVFKGGKGYSSYYGHEYVSTHMAVHFLTELGFEKPLILNVANIIQNHMKILHGKDVGAREIYHDHGGEFQTKMYIFKEADERAKGLK
ncbi:AAA family ATPase [Chengkuizengella sediminis]|uniref:AAA family ATPase n=1 Tax=Chengkuizengella sediminis TaxID=1885917 RepID=UPI001F111AAC|nr:AAA family ATPase [Chengkuizengella sediminis]